jgi:hypothetical protein
MAETTVRLSIRRLPNVVNGEEFFNDWLYVNDVQMCGPLLTHEAECLTNVILNKTVGVNKITITDANGAFTTSQPTKD